MRVKAVACLVALVVAAAPAYAQQTKLVETRGSWSVHTGSASGKKVCFVVAQPAESEPKNVKRGPIYFYISIYPAEKIANEISIKMGYPLRPGVDAEVKIGDAVFKLFTKKEGAYVEKVADENKLVAAMKAGAEMVVQGRSTRGTLTTDKYSLSGITAALESGAKACQ
jgi:invasion protein IalB